MKNMPVKKEEGEYIGNYKNKEFREAHKEYIMRKVLCKCGTMITYCNASHHKKTEKHIHLMGIIEIDRDDDEPKEYFGKEKEDRLYKLILTELKEIESDEDNSRIDKLEKILHDIRGY